MKKILTFQNGMFLISDGRTLLPSEIKGSPRVGSMINDDDEVVHSSVDVDCVGGSCPIR